MKFQAFQPHPFLSGIIRAYIVQQGVFEREISTVLGAKGVGALMFPFNAPVVSRLQQGYPAAIFDQPMLIGSTLVGNQATYAGPVNLLICVLQATGVYHLLRSDSHLVTNCVHSVDALQLPAIFQEAQDRLWAIKDGQSAVRLVESYFLHYFSVLAPPSWRHDLGPVTHYIERGLGQIPIQALAKKFRVTPRALEKSFLRQVGTTPKEYSRVMRFKAVMQYIRRHPGVDWLNVVAQFNYTDQSHLVRDFRQFSGYPPTQLFANSVEIDQQLYQHMQ